MATVDLIRELSNLPEATDKASDLKSQSLRKLIQDVKQKLDERLPYKRQKTGAELEQEQKKGLSSPKWSSGEISTLIYGVLRLSEKDISNDFMNQTLFMKREHDLKKAENLAVALPEKSKHSSQDIMEMWSKIKVLMSLDVDRLVASQDSKLVT